MSPEHQDLFVPYLLPLSGSSHAPLAAKCVWATLHVCRMQVQSVISDLRGRAGHSMRLLVAEPFQRA